MRERIILLTIVFCTTALTSVERASAQAWVKPKDGFYFKPTASFLYSEEEFDFRGDKQMIFADDSTRSENSFRDLSFSAYYEYGMTDKLTFVGQVAFKILTAKETVTGIIGSDPLKNTLTNGGLADVLLSVRAPIVQGPTALSVQTGVKIPLGYEQNPDNSGPPLGTGEFDFEGHVFAGQSLYPIPAYLGAGIGYRVRGGDFNDEILFSVEGGYTWKQLFIKLRFDGVKNTKDPPDLSISTENVIVGDQDVFKISPVASYSLNDAVSIAAEMYTTIAGKNTVAGTTYALGLVYAK